MQAFELVHAEVLAPLKDYIFKGNPRQPLYKHVKNFSDVHFYSERGRTKISFMIQGQKLKEGQKPRINWLVQAGPFGKLLRPGNYEAKLELLTLETLELIEKRIKIWDQETGHLLEPCYSKEPQFWIPELLAKALIFTQFSSLQSEFLAKKRTLARMPHYEMWWQVEKTSKGYYRLTQYDHVMTQAKKIHNLISPDHVGRGFLPVDDYMGQDLNIPVLGKFGREFVSVGPIKKAINRIKLASHAASAKAGTFKVLILEDVPAEFKTWHETGGAYVPERVWERFGPSRVTNKYLLKGVLTPLIGNYEQVLEEQYPELVGNDWVVVAKNSYKGELQGIQEAFEASGTGIAGISFKWEGVTHSGWLVNMPIEITNLVVAYGISVHQDVKAAPLEKLEAFKDDPLMGGFVKFYIRHYLLRNGNDDVVNERDPEASDEEVYQSSGVYIWLLEEITRTKGQFKAVDFIIEGLEKGIFEQSKTVARVKQSDVLNVYASHGESAARSFAAGVLKHKYYRELDDYLTNPDFRMVEIVPEVYHKIADYVFPRDRLATTGNNMIKPKQLGTDQERYQTVLDLFLNGGGKSEWDGLLGDKAKMVKIGQYEFYIPSGKVLKRFIFKEQDRHGKETGNIYFTGPAYSVVGLFRALSQFGELADMQTKIMWYVYQSKLMSSMYGEYGDNYVVPGFANKMIVPLYWNTEAEYVCCSDERFADFNGKDVAVSKMPVLFDKALSSMPYRHLDKFGTNKSKAFMYALSCCVFVPTKLLLAHQNDCDGDLIRIMFIDAPDLPRFTGNKEDLPKHMHGWVDTYSEGERDLEIKPKDQVHNSLDVYNEALIESVRSKKAIGTATNFLNILGMVGQVYAPDVYGPIRSAHAMLVQEIVRGVKHDTSGSVLDFLEKGTFKKVFGTDYQPDSFYNELVDKSSSNKVDFAMQIHTMLKNYGFESTDVNKLCSLFDRLTGTLGKNAVNSAFPALKPLIENRYESLPVVFKYLQMHIWTMANRMDGLLGSAKYQAYEEFASGQKISWERKFFDSVDEEKFINNYFLFARPGMIKPETKGILGVLWQLLSTT